jgi:alkylhydroperoxidase family enzyme
MHTRYAVSTQHLIAAVLDSSGETDPALRHAVQEQAASLSGRSFQLAGQIPPELAAYVKKVVLHAYKTTDEDIEGLRGAGYSEDAIFELTLSAALGAGMARLERSLAALKGGKNAAQED